MKLHHTEWLNTKHFNENYFFNFNFESVFVKIIFFYYNIYKNCNQYNMFMIIIYKFKKNCNLLFLLELKNVSSDYYFLFPFRDYLKMIISSNFLKLKYK